VESINNNKALNIQTAWDGVQHNACASIMESLKEARVAELRKITKGEPLPPPVRQPLPVRDDVLAQALKEGRRALRTEYLANAVGDENVRAEYWRELKESIKMDEQSLERQNNRLAEEKLKEEATKFEAWINSEEAGLQSDPRSEALLNLIDQGMPGRAVSVVARQTLNTARLARLRWDGRLSAAKTEAKMLQDELEARKAGAAASAAAAGSASGGDQAMEHTRELGRLQGQVDQLQAQAKASMAREQALKEQVLVAEDAHKQLQQKHDEVYAKCSEHVTTIKQLQEKLKNKDVEKASAAPGTDSKRNTQDEPPKKCCVVM